MDERAFTTEELAGFDGKEGRPAYVGFKGKVYDVSASGMWEDGVHEDEHNAGVDLTDDGDFAPHGEYVLEPFPVMGTLAG
jgi:predicted heme/steroid binding protein